MRREHSRGPLCPDTWHAVPFRIETATDIAACALTVPIQDEVWSGDVAVPPQLMLAIVHNGGFGASAREYHRDFRGAMPDKLNAGLPSDRFYVEWPIGMDRTYRRLRGEDRPPVLDDAEREGIRYVLRADGTRPVLDDPPSGE